MNINFNGVSTTALTTGATNMLSSMGPLLVYILGITLGIAVISVIFSMFNRKHDDNDEEDDEEDDNDD